MQTVEMSWSHCGWRSCGSAGSCVGVTSGSARLTANVQCVIQLTGHLILCTVALHLMYCLQSTITVIACSYLCDTY